MATRNDPLAGLVGIYDRHFPASIDALAALAGRHPYRAIWLHSPAPDPAWWRGECVRYAPTPAVAGEAPTMVAIRLPAGDCFVCDMGRETRWPFGEHAYAGDARKTIAVIEHTLGIPLAWTPATVGLRLITATVGRRATLPPADLPHVTPAVPHWSRPLAPGEAERPWWHWYDLNAAYVASAGSTPLGVGTPSGDLWGVPDQQGKRAGIWPVKVNGANPVIQFDGWYDTAIVRAALAMQRKSGEIATGQGWIWADSDYCLRRWADRLWAARETFAAGDHRIGVATIKAIYTQAFGSLNSALRGDKPSPHYRPHWYEAIRGESSRRVWAAVQKYGAFAVNVDMLGIASDQADPLLAAPELTRRWEGLGGYKSALSVRPSAELRAAALAGRLSASQIVKECRKELAGGERSAA